jgi:hypothetical protein
VSNTGIYVNYPKNAGVEIGHSDGHSHSELCVKMPDDDNEFHLRYDFGRHETKSKLEVYENLAKA